MIQCQEELDVEKKIPLDIKSQELCKDGSGERKKEKDGKELERDKEA